MRTDCRRQRGYSLVELLIVLVILGVLAVSAVVYLSPNRAMAVRATMDELEATLMAAHKLAVSTGADVTLVTRNQWKESSPLELAYGNSSLGVPAILTAAQNASDAFRMRPGDRDHKNAAIAVGTSTDWNAAGLGNEDLKTVEPFKSEARFKDTISTDTLNLFQGSERTTVISGANKRFNETFWIKVMSVKDGIPQQGGPMGLLLVTANGATVYKFYNSGVRSGDKTWRRI